MNSNVYKKSVFLLQNQSLIMKLRIFSLLFVAMFFVGCFSCSNKPKRSRKPVTQITIQPKKNLVFGDSLSISAQVKVRNGELDKVELYIDNVLVKETTDLSFQYSIPELNELGKHQVKVVAIKTDGVEGTNYKSFTVLSDIKHDEYTYEVKNTYPHSTENFTQGLEIYKGKFYESTGENEKSWIYQFDLESGNALKSYKLENEYFGEGITIFEDKIYQLTYKAQKGFIYDVNSFARIDSFTYETKEGWGLTHNENYILKTDGSEFIHFLDPESLEVIKKLEVYTHKGPVKGLNELEYHKGIIYANIWTTNFAVKIDAKTGKVLGRIDFTGLLPVMQNQDQRIDVLNGIAIHPETEKMYITGKLWPKLFEVKLVKKD